MANIPFKITDYAGLDAHIKIWNTDGDYYHWSTQVFKAWDLADQPYLMMTELPVAGVGRAQYVATVEGNDINSSPETMYYSWAVFDNGTPNENDNPISYIYEIPITNGREGTLSEAVLAASQPLYAPAKAGDVQAAIGSLSGRKLQMTNPVSDDGYKIELIIGDDYSSFDGRALKWIVSGLSYDLTDAEIILAFEGGIELIGEVAELETGKFLITVDMTHISTLSFEPGFVDYQLAAKISGRQNTLIMGRSQRIAGLISPV